MKLTVEHVRQHYDGLAFGVFCYGDKRAGFYPLLPEFVAMIGPADRLCDIGCGAGFFLEEFERRGVAKDRLFGVDLAPANVRRVQERGFQAACGNVLALDQATDSFEFTFCAGVIHHTPDPSRALRELARITKPGGHIYLAVYNKWNPYFWLVHKATAPLRALHWRGWTKLTEFTYGLWKLAVQPVSYLVFGRRLDEQTCRALYMDQVLTPYAHLFSVADVVREADAAGLDLVARGSALSRMLIIAVLKVRPKQ